jgi:hypothetical protein
MKKALLFFGVFFLIIMSAVIGLNTAFGQDIYDHENLYLVDYPQDLNDWAWEYDWKTAKVIFTVDNHPELTQFERIDSMTANWAAREWGSNPTDFKENLAHGISTKTGVSYEYLLAISPRDKMKYIVQWYLQNGYKVAVKPLLIYRRSTINKYNPTKATPAIAP